MAGSSHQLGEPISDESDQEGDLAHMEQKEDEGVEELNYDHGIPPPSYISDDEIPVDAREDNPEEPETEEEQRQQSSLPEQITRQDEMDHPEEEWAEVTHDHLSGYTAQNRQTVQKLENPFEQPDIVEDLPIGSPPAYYSEDEANRIGNNNSPPKPGTSTGNQQQQQQLQQIQQPNGSAKGATSSLAGALTGMMLGNIAKPFEAMNKKVSSKDEFSEDEDDYDDMDAPAQTKSHLHLTPDEIQLINMKDEFSNHPLLIEPVLSPFLLEYIPAVGDIDAFIKIPRPDEVEDNIGLIQLDEPAIKQSDPTIIDMQLRSVAKESSETQETPVKKLERADKNSEAIENWIANIKELHRTKPPASVHYSKPLPDVEKLMQEWSPEFEKSLSGIQLPSAELDVDLQTFVDLSLSLVDIPVHKSRIQSLHLLFSLYAEFKNSQHFRNLAAQNQNNAFHETTDRLEL